MHKDAHHILVVDDDIRIGELLQKYLIDKGYFVSVAQNTKNALSIIQEIECHLIILDLMMPGEGGIEFTKRLRNEYSLKTPIIMLTAMGEIENRIDGLEIGADDYVVKPFEPKELLLRIKNIIKRSYSENFDINLGNFTYNLKTKILKNGYEQVFLTQSELSLLDLLLHNQNQILTREKLSSELNINERSVDVQIIRLRNKIESNPSRPEFLQTIRNQGYIFRV